MTDQWTKARESMLRALTKAVGYDYDSLYASKREWIDDRGNRHDVNTPYKCDFEDGLDAVLAALREHGYVVVPEKLSHKMARAWEYGPNGNPEDSLEDYWQPSYRDMIAAAEKERE